MTWVMRPQFVEERLRAVERRQRADDFLDVRQLEAVFVENLQPSLHQHVVVRLVARGAAQFLDPGLFRKGDPDFRNEDAFEVEGDDGLLHCVFIAQCRPCPAFR